MHLLAGLGVGGGQLIDKCSPLVGIEHVVVTGNLIRGELEPRVGEQRATIGMTRGGGRLEHQCDFDASLPEGTVRLEQMHHPESSNSRFSRVARDSTCPGTSRFAGQPRKERKV